MTKMPEKAVTEDDDTPQGLREGFGSLEHNPDTPMIMRDCIKETYVDKPNAETIFKAAIRIADDLKRRSFVEDDALKIVLDQLTIKLKFLKRAQHKSIVQAVQWVFKEQESGLTCTGALLKEGVCFLKDRPCRFNIEENHIRQAKRNIYAVGMPENWREFMANLHPGDAYYADWIYKELAKLEQEKNLIPGEKKTPIFVSYRTLASRVNAARRQGGMDFHAAARVIKLLEDVGLIKKVVQGKRGTMKGLANGYIRVIPFPLPNEESDGLTDVAAGKAGLADQTSQPKPAGTHTPANITHVS